VKFSQTDHPSAISDLDYSTTTYCHDAVTLHDCTALTLHWVCMQNFAAVRRAV